MIDYHIHTIRCKHAEGAMEQYVQRAIDAGLDEMGFSDHLPLVLEGMPPYTMDMPELPLYVADVLDMRKRFPQLPIRLGVEIDYVQGYEEPIRQLIAQHDFDYVLGSVHFIPPGSIDAARNDPPRWWCIDAPEEIEDWKRHDPDDVWHAWLGQMDRLARSGLCHVVAHVDLPKKFRFFPSEAVVAQYRPLAGTLAERGLICEINTAGLRKPCAEIYPRLDILRILNEAGVGITLGSDSHRPIDVAADLDKAVALARAAGYRYLHKWAATGRFEPVPL